MSTAASIHSTTGGTVATYAKKIAQKGKPDVEIILDDHIVEKAYTTFDSISGRVDFTAPHNARFDEIKITFEGTTRTYVDNVNPHSSKSMTVAKHNFLKLVMPMKETDYPQPRIAEAGRTYTFPFNFVIPDQLLPRACSHGCVTDHVHQAHLQLPPSLGERDVSILDDLTPDMAKIRYCVNAQVVRTREQDGTEAVLVEGSKKLRVVPAQAEAPPVSTGDGCDDYVLSKTKSLKKGMFFGKLGRITVAAAQTGALILPSPASPTSAPPTTMATLRLRFDPSDSSSEPPRLGGLNTKIKTSTFFAARPSASFPSHHDRLSRFSLLNGVYDTSTQLSSRCVESVSWTKHAPHSQRRDSDSSTCSSDYSDNVYTPDAKLDLGFYKATILVPITLPATKSWTPTFHGCIVSRVYTIDLSLTIHTPGTGVPASTVTLHLPVQIAALGNQTERAPMTAAEAAAELVDANNFFVPRLIEVPSQELIGNSVLASAVPSDLPPSYEDFFSQPRALSPGRS